MSITQITNGSTNSVPDLTERTLLAACLAEGTVPKCNPDDFCMERHRFIAEIMFDLYRKNLPIDLVTVWDQAESIRENFISATLLAEISEYATSGRNIEAYSKSIIRQSALRKMRLKSESFLSRCGTVSSDGIDEFLRAYSREMLDTNLPENSRDQSINDIAREMIQSLERTMTQGGITGLSTGINKLDDMTCGMHGHDLFIVAARPSMGKTAIAIQIMCSVANSGRKVLMFSLDMKATSILQRIVSRISAVPLSKIRSGNLNVAEYATVTEMTHKVTQWPITIIDRPATDIDVIQKTKEIDPDLVLVDYLQLVNPSTKTGNANYDYGEVSKAMKHMANEQNIPVILLSQLSRGAEKENRMPRLSDLRDSGQIEQDADLILFLHAEKGDHTTEKREVILAKQRQGDCGIWSMKFNRKIQRFEE